MTDVSSRLDRVRLAALTILAALLPFELKTPIVTFGPLAITNVELALYIALLIWSASRALTRRSRPATAGWTPVHSAVLAWGAALLLSAAFAPAERDATVKFALRSLGGCALFFAAADLVTEPERAAQVMLAVVGGGLVSALAALAEVWLPDAPSLLLAFKTQTTLVGSFIRAGGTFQYANIGAMYWEAVMPMALGLGCWSALRGGRARWRWAGASAALTMAAAVVSSASRAGLLVAGLVLSAFTLIGWRSLRPLTGPAAAGLIGLATFTLVSLAVGPVLALRLRSRDAATWYRAEYISLSSSPQVEARQVMTVSLTVRNNGLLTWPAVGNQAVLLSYHWQDSASDRTVIFEGWRTPLPAEVTPGAEVTLAAFVLAPTEPGRYLLQWDMVQESVLWFSALGGQTGDMEVRVTPASTRSVEPAPPPVPRWIIQPQPARRDLWLAGLRMWRERPVLGHGPDSFRHMYGSYLGLAQYDNRVHANSLYVETLATLGLAGAAALIALAGTLTRAVRRGWRAARGASSVTERILALGLLAGLIAYFVHGLADYFFEFTPTYGLFWLTAGMTAGLMRRAEQRA